MAERPPATEQYAASPDPEQFPADFDITAFGSAEEIAAVRKEVEESYAQRSAERQPEITEAREQVDALFAGESEQAAVSERSSQPDYYVDGKQIELQNSYVDARGNKWIVYHEQIGEHVVEKQSMKFETREHGADAAKEKDVKGIEPDASGQLSTEVTVEPIAERQPEDGKEVDEALQAANRHLEEVQAERAEETKDAAPDEILDEVAPESEKEKTDYGDDAAMDELIGFGMSAEAANRILDIRYNLRDNPDAFLRSSVTANLFERSGLPKEQKQEFTELLGTIHDKLTAVEEEEQGKDEPESEKNQEKAAQEQAKEIQGAAIGKLGELRQNLERNGNLQMRQIEAAMDGLAEEIKKLSRITNDLSLRDISRRIEDNLGSVERTLRIAGMRELDQEEALRGLDAVLIEADQDSELPEDMRGSLKKTRQMVSWKKGVAGPNSDTKLLFDTLSELSQRNREGYGNYTAAQLASALKVMNTKLTRFQDARRTQAARFR